MVSKVVAMLLGAVVAPAALLFHTELKSSVPERDSTVKGPPREVILTFTGKVNPKLSSIAIVRPADSSDVMKLVIDTKVAGKELHAPLTRPIPPGRYVVRWKTASADGHVVRGAYAFSVDFVE